VDAAVARLGDSVLQLQLEIAWRPPLPDDEGVALDDGVRRDLADQRAILHAPVHGITGPAVQRCAVEDRDESGFVSVDGFRTIALAGYVLPGSRAGLLRSQADGQAGQDERGRSRTSCPAAPVVVVQGM